MSQTASIWLVIAAAVMGANLPFLSERLLALVALPRGKSLGWRLVELIVCYFLVGGLGLALEQRMGQIARQGWEFYAVTGALFITLAFPGFIWRYLFKHRKNHERA